uniref:Uncharacterized protein n=1 Tax=Acrobeloides nanus TaxID=290746 RepID=A0A914D5T2_9BILA
PRQAGVVLSPRLIPTHQTPATRERIPELQPLVMIEPIDHNLLPKQANDGEQLSLARFVKLSIKGAKVLW